jgi:hypothetical protein
MTAIAVGALTRKVGSVDTPFTVEAELAAPVRAWLNTLSGVVAVGDEVDGGAGIADLVAGTAATPLMPTRAPFPTPMATRLLERLQCPATREELADWAPHGWRALHDRTLEPLLALGLVEALPGNDPLPQAGQAYRARVSAADPFSSLIAVELKLKDWRRAIAQAGRYRLFAERSYVALPAERVTDQVVTLARRNRVGVLAVPARGRVRLVEDAEAGVPLQPTRRRWASEQVLAAVTSPSPRPAGSPIRQPRPAASTTRSPLVMHTIG